MFRSPRLTAALGTALMALGLTTIAHAAEIFRLERQYNAMSAQFYAIADGEFYWLESIEHPIGQPEAFRLTGIDALTGATVIPKALADPGKAFAPYIFAEYFVLSEGGHGIETWSIYDRKTGERVGARGLVDGVWSAVIKDNVLILAQYGRRGGYLTRFSVPRMNFLGETRIPALTDIDAPTFFDGTIVGFRTRRCVSESRCPTELVGISLDGVETFAIELTDKSRSWCGLPFRIVDAFGPRIVAYLGCGLYVVVDLEQRRLLRTLPQFPKTLAAWVVLSDNFVFMRPESSVPATEGGPTGRDIYVFDLESGRDLGRADLAPGGIKVVGSKLLLRPYQNSDIFVYAIDAGALR